jgi:hypothetical protein
VSHDRQSSISKESGAAERTEAKLKGGIARGLGRGLHGFLWIVKILVPVSLAVALLDWTGWLYVLDPVFRPAMGLINLPPQAALPVLTALLSSFYAAFAMMLVIPFSAPQLIMLAIFMSIAHMFIIEGTIQHKAGMNGPAMVALRFVTACIVVVIVSWFFDDTAAPVVMPQSITTHAAIEAVLSAWAVSTLKLLLKILLIMVPVAAVLELMKVFGWTERVARVFRPLMNVLGLSPNVATMWVAGTFFGIIYGSALIVEESTSGRYSQDELRRLHIALGLNHSIVEDPALFLAAGIGLFWTVVPRLVAAVAAVHLYRLCRALQPRLRSGSFRTAGRARPEPR